MAVTDFDTEKLDQKTQNKATERVNKVLHPAAEAHVVGGESGEAALAQQVMRSAPAPAAAPAAPVRKRRQRSDAGKPKTTPGMVTVKFECPISEATDLLGYMIRTHHPDIAHQLVDALAKAQKAEA